MRVVVLSSWLSVPFVMLGALACRHMEAEQPSRWQVSYTGSGAAVNYADAGGKTLQGQVQIMKSCAAAGVDKYVCKNPSGWTAVFTMQDTVATMWGRSSAGVSPSGTITLHCRSPFAPGQAVVCDEAATPP